MNWLTRRLGKLTKARSEPQAPAPSPAGLRLEATPPADLDGRSDPSRSQPSPGAPPPSQLVPELGSDPDDDDEADDPEPDEDDPTIGRYEQLEVSELHASVVAAARDEARHEALTGPQKVYVWDPAGPGSLAETLARLEAEGRFTSRVCEDADAGPYILYEPVASGSPPA